MMTDKHSHNWERINKKHGRQNFFFVQCKDKDCVVIRQATIKHGYLSTFTTSVNKGGKTKAIPVRLDPIRKRKLRKSGVNPRKILEDWIDENL